MTKRKVFVLIIQSYITADVSGVAFTRNPNGTITEKTEDGKEIAYSYFLMATEKGVIKKTALEEYKKIRSNGLTAIKLEDGDQLTWVKPTTGNNDIVIVTADGKSVRFKESDVRPMGRSTKGVTAIKFKNPTDYVVGMGIIKDDKEKLLTLSDNGYGKMTTLKEYPLQKRGGTGVFTFRVTPKTGRIASARIIEKGEEEIVVISQKAKVIRSELKAVPTLGRQTSGVKLMNMNGEDSVATVAIL